MNLFLVTTCIFSYFHLTSGETMIHFDCGCYLETEGLSCLYFFAVRAIQFPKPAHSDSPSHLHLRLRAFDYAKHIGSAQDGVRYNLSLIHI